VSGKIALAIAINIQPPHHSPSPHGLLPDARVNRLAMPCDVAGKAYVD
jgi:hypothetical protein